MIKKLGTIILAGAMALGAVGCQDKCEGKCLPQEEIEAIYERITNVWVDKTNDYLSLHKSISEGEYQKVQTELEESLREDLMRGQEAKILLNSGKKAGKITEPAAEVINDMLDNQMDKLKNYLDNTEDN